MHQEFPKCLYLGGNVEAVYCVVLDPQEEAQARQAGYSSVGESQAKAKTPRKAKAL